KPALQEAPHRILDRVMRSRDRVWSRKHEEHFRESARRPRAIAISERRESRRQCGRTIGIGWDADHRDAVGQLTVDRIDS
ncbi:MAG: hypothetical protein ACC628_27795, partial [Pirellulaceae bacterium]